MHKLISIALRYAKPGSGSHENFLRNKTLTIPIPDIKKILRKTPYVIVGGIATRLYMPERMTLDLDILITVENVLEAEDELKYAGCRKKGILSIGGSTWTLPDQTSLDIIVSDEMWGKEAIRHPNIGSDGLPYIDLPYLILMKFKSGRVQDMADISRMLGNADEDNLQEVRKIIRYYLPDVTEDLNSLISLGKLEMQKTV